jgi:hypothetical protein
MEFTEFVLHHLPQAPARVLEVGCGDRGGVVPSLVEAGYDAIGVDPRGRASARPTFARSRVSSTPSSPAA